MFPGSDNARVEAMAFVSLLGWLAREIGSAATPPLPGWPSSVAAEFSGSTTWNAAVRSRWWLKRQDSDPMEGDQGDGEFLWEPRRVKSNDSGTDDVIVLEWQDSALVSRGGHKSELCVRVGDGGLKGGSISWR